MMTDSKQIELKPCPFCGSDKVDGMFIRDGWRVGCRDCGAGVPAYHPNAHAISADKWNRRSEMTANFLPCPICGLDADLLGVGGQPVSPPSADNPSVEPEGFFDDQFETPVTTDTALQSAAREAGWALSTLVDEIEFEKRQQVVNIINRLSAALYATA